MTASPTPKGQGTMIDPAILASAVKRAKDELHFIPEDEEGTKAQTEALIAAGEAWLKEHASPDQHDTASYY